MLAAESETGSAVVVEKGGVLSKDEVSTLRHMERIISKHIDGVRQTSVALATIRHKRLYRDVAATFELYCASRWGFGASRARQLIGAGRVLSALPEGGPQPNSERQLRALARVPEGDVANVWKRACDACDNGDSPSAEKLNAIADEFVDPDAPRTGRKKKVHECAKCGDESAHKTVYVCSTCFPGLYDVD